LVNGAQIIDPGTSDLVLPKGFSQRGDGGGVVFFENGASGRELKLGGAAS
jgi:hypothetical protein